MIVERGDVRNVVALAHGHFNSILLNLRRFHDPAVGASGADGKGRPLSDQPPLTASNSLSASTRVSILTRSSFEVSLVLLMIFSIKPARTIHAGAATLAQQCRRSCELVHRRHPNPTFCDGHHSGARYCSMRRAFALHNWRVTRTTASVQRASKSHGARARPISRLLFSPSRTNRAPTMAMTSAVGCLRK
jgi:hypothetical protein